MLLRWSRIFNRVERRSTTIGEGGVKMQLPDEDAALKRAVARTQAEVRRQVEFLEAQVRVAEGGIR